MPSAQRGRAELHWGIVGLGKIANDFVLAMAHSQHPNKVVAVATSNSEERAQKFKEKLALDNAVKTYGSYEELMRDPNVDVVYISAMNNTHLPLVISALEHGKHVLCEKPIVYKASEVDDIQRVQKAINQQNGKNLFVMEGFWSRFFPSWQRIREVIRSGKMGAPKMISADFCALLPENRHELSMGECTLTDIGCYPITLATFVFEGKKVVSVKAHGVKNDKGTDIWSHVIVQFEGGQYALCHCNSLSVTNSAAMVTMEKGLLALPERFWSATELRRCSEVPLGKSIEWQSEQFPFPERKDGKKPSTDFVFHNSCGLNYEADHVWECIENGKTESEVASLEESKKVASILEEALKQMDIKLKRAPEDTPDLSKYQK